MRLWRIATDTPNYEAHDLTGKGAEQTGGRWNRPGSPMVYASTTIALACLETTVNLNVGALPANRFLVAIDIPDYVWDARESILEPPIGWTATPPGKVSLDLGEDWLKRGKSALLLVPSVVVHEEFNLLLNPKHPDCKCMQAQKIRPWTYDGRMR